MLRSASTNLAEADGEVEHTETIYTIYKPCCAWGSTVGLDFRAPHPS